MGFLAIFLLPIGFLALFQFVEWTYDTWTVRHRAIPLPDDDDLSIDAEAVTQKIVMRLDDQDIA